METIKIQEGVYDSEVQGLLSSLNSQELYERMHKLAIKYERDTEDVEHDFSEVLEKRLMTYMGKMAKQKPVQRALTQTRVILWLSKFVESNNAAKTLLERLTMEDKPLEIHNLKSLSELSINRKSRYFVEGMFRCGLFMVAGQAKTGKSLFGFDLAMSLVLNVKFLDRNVTPCNVLIIENEESLVDTGEKLLNSYLQEFQLQSPQEYEELINSHRLIVAKNLDIAIDSDKIFKLIDDYNIGCVVVDSLRASISKSGFTEMDLQCALILYRFQAEIHNRGMMGLVIHHCNKSDNNEGKTDSLKAVSGSSSVIGANDGVVKIVLNPKKRYEGRETIDLFFFPRSDNPISLNFVYTEGEACRWGFTVLDEYTLSPDFKEDILSILEILLAHIDEHKEMIEKGYTEYPIGLTLEDIGDMMGRTRGSLITVSNYLLKTNAIKKERFHKGKWMFYIDPEDSSAMDLIEEASRSRTMLEKQEAVDSSVLDAIMNCNSVAELDGVFASISDSDKDRISMKLTKDHHAHIFKRREPPLYKIGDWAYPTFLDDVDVTFDIQLRMIDEVTIDMNHNKFTQASYLYHLQGLNDLLTASEIKVVPDNHQLTIAIDTQIVVAS